MNRFVLFFDLAWTGITGWAVYDRQDDVWYAWGQFKPQRAQPGLDYTAALEWKFKKLAEEIEQVVSLDAWRLWKPVVGYEYTDWHGGADDAPQIGRDRAVIRALAQAEMTLWHVCHRLEIVALGANEIKQEFGGKDKMEIARLVAAQWPEQFWVERHKHGLLKSALGPVSHDTSDAMAGAYVLTRRLKLKEMIEDEGDNG